MLNAAARLVYSRRMSEHTTPLLRELHWLRVPERITSGSVFWHTTVYTVQHRRMADSRRLTSTSLLVAVCVLSTPRRCWCCQPVDQLSATCSCSEGVEQSATTDQGRLLATDILAGVQVLSFFVSHLTDLTLSPLIDSF